MRKISRILLLFSALLLIITACKTNQYATKYATAPSTEELTTNVGDTLKIEIESNPTTGYSWEAVYYTDNKVLKFVEKKYNATNTNSKLMGAGGKEVFIFVAKKAGTTNVAFEYKRTDVSEKNKVYKVTCVAKK